MSTACFITVLLLSGYPKTFNPVLIPFFRIQIVFSCLDLVCSLVMSIRVYLCAYTRVFIRARAYMRLMAIFRTVDAFLDIQ